MTGQNFACGRRLVLTPAAFRGMIGHQLSAALRVVDDDLSAKTWAIIL